MSVKIVTFVLLYLYLYSNRAYSEDVIIPNAESLWKKHLKITTNLDPPFTFEKDGFFRGFIPDLIRLILQDINATYELYAVPDGNYGSQLANGKWNGLIGEVIGNGVTGADIAAAPLTITSHRANVVKFSFPFMPANIIPLIKKPTRTGAHMPFATIKEMTEVAAKGKITYGIVKDGATEVMLKNSKYTLYREMYSQIHREAEAGRNPFVRNYEEAVERIRNESNYVFLGEDAALDYIAGRKPCDLIHWSHKPLNTAFYGFAFPITVPQNFVDYINLRLIYLQRTGEMKYLKDKWWENECKKPKMCVCREHDHEEQRYGNSTVRDSDESNESFAEEASKKFEG